MTTPGKPLISVIMPCYNAAPYLGEAINSALGQSYGNVEIVVVDDGSTDGSEVLLERMFREHGGRIRVLSANRIGPYPARNLALRHAHGELIAFLDADDWWRQDALERLHAAMTEHDADLAYCGWQNVGEDIQSSPHVPPAYEEEDPVAHFVRTCPWPIHAALVKKEIVDRLEGFSERRFASMDYDFWLRVLALTRRIKRVPEVLAFYRWHNMGQISAVKWRQVLDALAAQKDFIRNNPGLVAHLPVETLRDLTEGQVLRQAYRAFWKRDLESAHRLFRHAAVNWSCKIGDLRHVTAALLPFSIYLRLMQIIDRRQG